MKTTSFPPIATIHAKVLILGSMPGLQSLKLNQYYAHPQNAFWYIMGNISGFSPQLPYAERINMLEKSGVALWDVLQHAEREGSLDSNIKGSTEIPNDFDGFLSTHDRIRGIFFNGAKAAKAFKKHVKPTLQAHALERLTFSTLPSTSPANTGMTRYAKLNAWREIEKFLA